MVLRITPVAAVVPPDQRSIDASTCPFRPDLSDAGRWNCVHRSCAGARAETTSVTLAGSLQGELGCSADWQPDCAATHLTQVAGTDAWQATFDVPAGSYEFKVALNDNWDVSYGAGGVLDGANIPLNLVGDASLVFSFDAGSHQIGVRPAGDSKFDHPGRPVAGQELAALFANRRALLLPDG